MYSSFRSRLIYSIITCNYCALLECSSLFHLFLQNDQTVPIGMLLMSWMFLNNTVWPRAYCPKSIPSVTCIPTISRWNNIYRFGFLVTSGRWYCCNCHCRCCSLCGSFVSLPSGGTICEEDDDDCCFVVYAANRSSAWILFFKIIFQFQIVTLSSRLRFLIHDSYLLLFLPALFHDITSWFLRSRRGDWCSCVLFRNLISDPFRELYKSCLASSSILNKVVRLVLFLVGRAFLSLHFDIASEVCVAMNIFSNKVLIFEWHTIPDLKYK